MTRLGPEPWMYGRGQPRLAIGPRAFRRSEWRDGCLIYLGPADRDGYGRVSYQNRTMRLHRAVWEEVRGPIPPGMQVCHTCDQPGCWLLAHLFLCTQQQNMTDKMAKGRAIGWPKGRSRK